MIEKNKARIGVIGLGTISQRAHLPWYWENPNAEILAVCSDIEEEAKSVAKRWQARYWFTDYHDLLDLEEINAISICTPVWLHNEISVKAAKKGKNILCEKPMARNIKECNEMIEEAKRNNVILMIGFMKRFNPGFQKIKEIIDKGIIGEVHHMDIHWNLYFPPGSRPSNIFSEDKRIGGGVLLDNFCHYIDTFRWILSSEIKTTFAEISKIIKQRIYEDQAIVVLRFKNNATAILDMGFNRVEYVEKSAWEDESKYSMQFSELGFIYGTKGTIYFDAPPFESVESVNIKIYILKGENCIFGGWHNIEIPIVRQPGGPLTPREVSSYAFKRQIDHFVDCVCKNKKPLVTGVDGKITIQVIENAYESAKIGKKLFYNS